MVDLTKVKLYSQSWYNSTEYDALIGDIILNAEAYINELISWRYVPKTYNFKQFAYVESDGLVYLDKKPVLSINSISKQDNTPITDFSLDNYGGIICLKCNNSGCSCLMQNVIVDYSVGGLATDYPLAIDNIILDLVLKKLNFAINNAQGFTSFKIGSDINMNFMFELTEEQKTTIKKYQDQL